MNNSILIQNVTLEDIEQAISKCVKKEVSAFLAGFNQPATGKPSALITRKEAASRLGVSLTTIDNWTRNGILNSIRIGGRTYFYETELKMTK